MDTLNFILGTGYFEKNLLITFGEILLLVAFYQLIKNIVRFARYKVSDKQAVQKYLAKTQTFGKILHTALFILFVGIILIIFSYNA